MESNVPLADSKFGRYYNLDGYWDKRPGAMVVATRRYELKPARLLLPHQLYEATAQELMDADWAQELYVLPVRDKWVRVL